MEAELYARARALQQLNDELRKAHARERQVAVTLQEAMLHSPDLAGHQDIAVRYMPAAGSLNVCGDWYDVVDLPGGFAVAVGDVVGHGLEAAATMGMLRSALSAAVRALHEPARALEVLGLYARSVEGALATTAAEAVIDNRVHRIRYSSAGHLPPVLVHPDGSFGLLDQATDPRWAPAPATCPAPRPSCPTPRETPSCSTPTGSSNAGERTSTSACAGSPTLSPATPVLLPNAWPTRCLPASVSAAADATTSPWSSCASRPCRHVPTGPGGRGPVRAAVSRGRGTARPRRSCR